MSRSIQCPECGAPMTGGVEGNCPRCLMQLGKQSNPPGPEDPGMSGGEAIRHLGDYELLEEIARGGMGAVYRARQASLNRPVAVKVLLGGHFASAEFIQRFRREAQAAAGLNHPNIVAIHEVGEHNGQPYFSMELIEGRSLAERIREQPPAARQAAQWLKTIAEAVQFAHERGVLHRDLKPSNILVDASGAPHVTDFGLAKRFVAADVSRLTSHAEKTGEWESEKVRKREHATESHLPTFPPARLPNDGDQSRLTTAATDDLTLPGQVLGSPNYMPPEQAEPQRSEPIAASDVYSLGAILYHLITGRPPFMAETVTQTLRLVSEGDLVPPHLLNPNLSRDLETICLKCLETDPKRRYASAQELADELGRFLNDEPIRARPIGRVGRLRRWRRRKPALAASLGAGAVLLLVVAIGSPIALYRIERAREAAEAARQQEAALRVRAESAERTTEGQLYTALLEQARATVLSGEMGHRVRALGALRRAAAISNTAELRREVFAALALPDLRFERELPLDREVTLVRLDPAFERIALGRGRGPVEIRSVADNQLLATLPASTNRPAHDREWSADGRFLAVKRDLDGGGWWADWEVWDVAEQRRVLLLHNASFSAFGFHPRLPRVIACQRTEGTGIWNLEDGRELLRFPQLGRAFVLEFSPEGDRFAAVSLRGRAWLVSAHDARNPATTELWSQAIRDKVDTLTWHPEGHSLVVPDHGGNVHWLHAETGGIETLGRHKWQAVRAEFSPDGAYLFTGGFEKEFICWDTRTRRRVFTASLNSHQLQFSADGRRCAVTLLSRGATSSGLQLHAFEQPTAHREFAEDLGTRLQRASISPDGRWLAASDDRRAGIWDLSTGGPGAIETNAYNTHFFFAPNGQELFGSRNAQGDAACFRWKLTPATNAAEPPGVMRLPLSRPRDFTSLSLSSNSVVMTTARGSQLLTEEELETGSDRWARTHPGNNGASPDGLWLGVYRSFTPSLYIHRLPGLERAAKLTHPANFTGFEFSPSGDEVAIMSSRAGVEFWSTTNWQRTRLLTNFNRVLYAPDGRALWLVRGERTSGLYDQRTQEPLLLLPTGLLPLAVSPDGRHLAVSVDAQRLQLWDLAALRQQLRELGMDWGR